MILRRLVLPYLGLRKLAPKLILSLTIIVVIIGVISGLVNARSQERQILNAMILGADQLSRSITSSTWQAMLADHREAAYEVMRTIAHKQGIDRIRMFNREAQMMFSTDPRDATGSIDWRARECGACHSTRARRIGSDIPARTRILPASDGRGRSLAMVTPIYNEPACSQAACHAHPASVKVLGVLEVMLNLEPVDREVQATHRYVATITLIQVLISSVLIFFFTRHFVARPIQRLVERTRAVSAENLDRPVDIIESSEELEELSREFEAMRVRLQLAMDEIREFTQTLEHKVEQRTDQLEQAHRKLIHSDRLASLGQLAASVAHEINNPVAGVLNLSMLMNRILTDEGVPPGRLQDFRRYLTQVINETSRVGRIVSDLLAFSRRSKPQRTEADLNRIIRTTQSLVAHKLKLSNIELELKLDDALPLVPCDASQMQQVILNLLLNAAEATHGREGSRVLIETRQAGPDAISCTVSDNGEGIAPENLKKIFDPFFTTKPEGKGVGLGLAVLYGIVQAHGGDIHVESTPGRGARFTVTLPLEEHTGESAEAASAARA